MRVAYISGPYRSKTIHGVLENIRKAEKVAIRFWKLGYAVICPHMNTALMDGICDDATWLTGDLEIISRLDPMRGDVLVAMKDYEGSVGSVIEIEKAIERGIEIIYEEERVIN